MAKAEGSSILAAVTPALVIAMLVTLVVRLAPKSIAAPGQAGPTPVYVHMDGANAFVEPVVAVKPGQPVAFVNEDTGMHMIDSYNPLTGKITSAMAGVVQGTTGPTGTISTYKVAFKLPGFYYYYCPVHAVLSKIYHHSVQAAHRPGVHGFPGSMAGLIVVTTDKALIAENPPSSHKRILSDYFGG